MRALQAVLVPGVARVLLLVVARPAVVSVVVRVVAVPVLPVVAAAVPVVRAGVRVPVVADRPRVRSVAPVVPHVVDASRSVPSAKSSTTWKPPRLAASVFARATARPCGWPAVLR